MRKEAQPIITLEEALKIARKALGEWHSDEIMAPQPRVDETSEYWLFNFNKEDSDIVGFGAMAVYKADGKPWYVSSGEIPKFYENATPVSLPD
jgi:hypothetical protein